MKIKGIQKTTLLDYPGHVAATFFLGGCNFRCPFCHNMNLVTGNEADISEEEIKEFLKKRQGIIDGVCITGGEPTLYPELPDFISKIKSFGYLVKLDTNGTNPEMIRTLSENGLIDYIAMDIKTRRKDYLHVSGIDNVGLVDNVKKSIQYIINGKTDYEFRTTIVKQYHNEEVIKDIAEEIKGAKKYFLQNYIESKYVPDKLLTACTTEELIKFKQILEKTGIITEIRGVEI